MTLEEFIITLRSMDQDALKAMLEARHPEYEQNLDHWRFLKATYEGGRDWFKHNLFKYYKEGDNAFEKRRDRAYRFNHTREVCDLVNKYVFKPETQRRTEDVPDAIKRFWEQATHSRQPIETAMKSISLKSSIYGLTWVAVDSNKPAEVKTRREEIETGARVYTYTINPDCALDMGYDDDGELTWFLAEESYRDDAMPWDTRQIRTRYRLWTRYFWASFTKRTEKNETVYEFESANQHDLGVVPIIPAEHITGEEEDRYASPALINDAAYLDRAVANYLSNLDAIIQDQTFSQLIIPAQGMMPDDNSEHDALIRMGTKSIFTYDAEANYKPEYIGPSPSHAQLILSVVEKIISEIYHSTGLAGERTKQDNSMSIDNSSGVAKAYDFHKMNAMLAAKASALQAVEERMMDIVMRWNSEIYEKPEDTPFVQYPEEFDVRNLANEMDIAQNLGLMSAPKKLRREHMKQTGKKLLPTVSDSKRKEIDKEIDNEWLKEPEIDEGEPGGASSPPTLPGKENNQGEVTTDTE